MRSEQIATNIYNHTVSLKLANNIKQPNRDPLRKELKIKLRKERIFEGVIFSIKFCLYNGNPSNRFE